MLVAMVVVWLFLGCLPDGEWVPVTYEWQWGHFG